ncbi:ABC transporter permease [Legionella dresdenensis]|uniref:ABC transporter permease n=1 Tax=Legionella dresdenensis TaxID=450200 RepID=A0ABV8CFK9_9GAMM
MELLWTDKCFLVMLLAGLIVLLAGLRKEPFRVALQQLLHKPLALNSGIILMFFLVIGVVDSIHFRTNDSTLESLLDRMVAPIGDFYEKTYSAPLALTLYSTETVVINDKVQQVYPRLKYPPAHYNTGERNRQIAKIAGYALAWALAGTLLLCLAIMAFKHFYLRQRLRLSGVTVSGLVTFGICLFVLAASYWLSRDFHLLGTGKIGQDIFFYTIKSIRTGLVIGTLTTLFMLPLALLFGIAAGYFGGVIDDIIQYIYTTLSSIPGVLLITASVLSMQTYIASHPDQFTSLDQNADARLFALCLILGVTSWTSLCRLLRAEALKLREMDYVLAAKALGSSSLRIIRKHLLPNVMPIVLITLVLDFSFLVLAEAVLSYVGVGVSPMTISWGNMINGARLELAQEPIVWWPMTAAFIFMFILVLASNLFSDAVRDVFDPYHAEY